MLLSSSHSLKGERSRRRKDYQQPIADDFHVRLANCELCNVNVIDLANDSGDVSLKRQCQPKARKGLARLRQL